MADIFWEGFDTYGIAGQVAFVGSTTLTAGTAILGYWTNGNGAGGSEGVIQCVPGRFSGQALQLAGGTAANFIYLNKTLPNNYATLIFGFAFQSSLGWTGCVQFLDSGTYQVSVGINTSGQIVVYRGNALSGGTLLATSTQSVTANSWHYLEGEITFNSSTGSVQIWLDGVATSINLTGVQTETSGHNYANVIEFQINSGASASFVIDDLYLFDNTGSVNNAQRGDSRVETLFPNADSSVTFSFGAAVFGAAYQGGAGSVSGVFTNAPGANELVLRRFKTGEGGTLNDVRILPAATITTANFKAVLYNDNGSGTAPSGAPITTGTQVTGCTSGTVLVMPFSSGQILAANTNYWIGFITDTSVALNESDNNGLGYKASNTYSSGAPTNPAMTIGQPSWMIWGNYTSTGVNWYEVAPTTPVGTQSYVYDSTVGDEDLFSHPPLSSTPSSIAGVKVTAYMQRSDSGARTISLRCKSGSADSGGSNTGQTPAGGSFTYLESYFDTDPNTAAAWTAPAVNASLIGYHIDS